MGFQAVPATENRPAKHVTRMWRDRTIRRCRTPIAIVVLAMIATGVWWVHPSGRRARTPAYEREALRPGPTSLPASASDVAIEDCLDRRLPEITLDAVGLGDVIDFYQDFTGARIKVDWQALTAVGLDRTAPISARIRNTRISKSLGMILDSAGGGQIRLGYVVEDGTIQISTVEEFRKRSIVRTYDVGNLAARASVASIIQQITASVARSSWSQHGGRTGVIMEFGNRLVVLQTRNNHQAIARLLDQMRQRSNPRDSSLSSPSQHAAP